jgi:hypothetical protein
MSWTAQPPPRAKRRRGVVATVAMTFVGLLLSASVTTAGGALVVRHEPVSQPAIQPPSIEQTPEPGVVTEANAAGASPVETEAHADDVAAPRTEDVEPAMEAKETRASDDVKPAVEARTQDAAASAPTTSSAAWKTRAPSLEDPFGLQPAAH